MKIKRGDIFYADLSPTVGSEQGGTRPVIVIQNDVGNKYSPTVVIAAITSQINKTKLPTYVEMSSEEYGLNKDSVVLLEQIRTIDKRRLKEKISTVSKNFLEYIDTALSVELNITGPVGNLKEQELKDYISHLTKPLLITEGKTAVQLIETAWENFIQGRICSFNVMLLE